MFIKTIATAFCIFALFLGVRNSRSPAAIAALCLLAATFLKSCIY